MADFDEAPLMLIFWNTEVKSVLVNMSFYLIDLNEIPIFTRLLVLSIDHSVI